MTYLSILLFSLFSSGLTDSVNFLFTPDLDDREWPSCEELRILWLNLNNLKKYSEITNEIPLIPTDLLKKVQKNHRHMTVPSSHRQRNIEISLQDISKNRNPLLSSTDVNSIQPVFQELAGAPNFKTPIPQHKSKSIMENFGHDFQIAESSKLPFFHDPMKGQRMPQPSSGMDQTNSVPQFDDYGFFDDLNLDGVYGKEENVGMFGDFSKEDETPAQHKTNIRTIKVDNSGWNAEPISIGSRLELPAIQDSCEKVFGQSCSSNSNCACVGWYSLRCIKGRCLSNQDIFTGQMADAGIWHNGPLPLNHLGVVKRRNKRSKLIPKHVRQ